MRAQIDRCRKLWNEFDPIGVLAGGEGPRDEYDSYLTQTIKYALSDPDQLTAYVRNAVRVQMGMISYPEREIERFANRVRAELSA